MATAFMAIARRIIFSTVQKLLRAMGVFSNSSHVVTILDDEARIGKMNVVNL